MEKSETQTTRRPLSIWEHERLIREARLSLPTMPTWALQPDAATTGLFIACQTLEQRKLIMRALGCVE